MKTFKALNKFNKEEYAFVQFWPDNSTSKYFCSFDPSLFCGIIPSTREAVLITLDIDGLNYICLENMPYCEEIIENSYINAFYKWDSMLYGQTYALNPENLDISSHIPAFKTKNIIIHKNSGITT